MKRNIPLGVTAVAAFVLLFVGFAVDSSLRVVSWAVSVVLFVVVIVWFLRHVGQPR